MALLKSARAIQTALDDLARRDARVKAALALVGPPPLRRVPEGYTTLLRAIVGQQLSTKAAASIWARLAAEIDTEDPASLRRLSAERMRALGLSWSKASYAHHLADAVGSGSLDLVGLRRLDDEAAIAELVLVKGIGRWTAEMYLLFALGRADIWPVDDLAVATGLTRMLGLAQRLARQELYAIGEDWRPWRSAAARLMWHYYSKAPL